MSKLSQIISNEKAIIEREAIVEPIQKEIEILLGETETLISKFLEETMIKRKKYYLEGHNLKWICYTHLTRDYNNNKGYDLFHCEFRADKAKSIIFKEYLNVSELYEAFKYSIFYKELVRESSLQSILDDK